MPDEFIPAQPQQDHTQDDPAPSEISERRKMLDRLAELQARRDALAEEELEELKRLARAL